MEVITMAIDAVGGVVSYQAQQITKPQVELQQHTAESKEGQDVQAVKMVDETTKIVEASDEKEGNSLQDAQQQQQEKQQVTNEQIRKTVEEINKKAMNSEVQFGIHEATNRVTIKIIDRQTKEVIKELPPEKTLDMIAKAWEIAGILVDEKR
jgi:flagellar protein FlaG